MPKVSEGVEVNFNWVTFQKVLPGGWDAYLEKCYSELRAAFGFSDARIPATMGGCVVFQKGIAYSFPGVGLNALKESVLGETVLRAMVSREINQCMM